ncbi:serine acetyltransferase [Nostoc sp. UIC 10630]|uniref:serine O-acetyltransferase n=1 Tax=Nostoc sp. UIC 10630 TaxID=2100146 RepID=UPI0013D6911C|nr:serine acetyltransferase [Nostoc sp. UIC 10630]NEU81521.1 serine acetyltransferase [Nostoc sp. UIC 10630]
MRDFIIKLVKTIIQIMNAPMLILFLVTTKKEVILVDVRRWSKIVELVDTSDWVNLLYLLYKYPEFRSLYYYRIKKGNFLGLVLMHIIKFFYKECPSLFLYCDNIGSGLFIQHGFSTIVNARSIGDNCWINQQVTIGYSSKNNFPTIGNNVIISSGAKVIGNVTINDNVIVGANAVVVKDVPSNCVVVGVPAYIIKRDGVKVKEQLI